MFMAVDPGYNVGVATFNSDGTDQHRRIVKLPEFRKFYLGTLLTSVMNRDIKKVTFIMEDFKLRQDKAIDQTGSDMPAPRCIGAVEMIDTILGASSTIVLVPPGNLNGSLKWAGMNQHANRGPRYHVPDDVAAYAHGVKYLIDQKLRKHPIFD